MIFLQENVYKRSGTGISIYKELHGDKNSAYAKYMGDAIFKVPTPLMLDKVVTAMDGNL